MKVTKELMRSSPKLVIVNSLVTKSPLLPLEPTWLADPSAQLRHGMIMLKGSFWLPVKEVRLVPHEEVGICQHRMAKGRAFLTLGLLWASIFGIGQALVPFEWFYSAGPHLALNLLAIATAPAIFVGIFFIRREMKPINDLEIAALSEPLRREVRKINISFWLFTLLMSVFTAILSALKTSVPLDDKGNQIAETVSTTAETLKEEGPTIAVGALSAADLGSASVAGAVSMGLFRMVFGLGATVAVATLLLWSLSFMLGDSPVPFLITIALAYVAIIWRIRSILKMQPPSAAPQPAT